MQREACARPKKHEAIGPESTGDTHNGQGKEEEKTKKLGERGNEGWAGREDGLSGRLEQEVIDGFLRRRERGGSVNGKFRGFGERGSESFRLEIQNVKMKLQNLLDLAFRISKSRFRISE